MDVARRSIEQGLANGRPLEVDLPGYPPDLRVSRASFVSLHRGGRLRGCIGHLEPVQALVVDIAQNAFAAAFQDPRFRPLTRRQWSGVRLHLSVLTPAERIDCRDQADLLRQLHPGEDGLILQDPADFLAELKRKAGLTPDHWSDQLEVYRYRTEAFGEAEDT